MRPSPFFACADTNLRGIMVQNTKIMTTAWKQCGALIFLLFAVAQCSHGTTTISSAALRLRGGGAATEVTNRWQGVPMAPADPILGVAVAFNADPSPQKINLGIGAYRTSEGGILFVHLHSTKTKPYYQENLWCFAAFEPLNNRSCPTLL